MHTRLVKKVGVFASNAFDPHHVGEMDDVEQSTFLDASLPGQVLTAFLMRGYQQEPVRAGHAEVDEPFSFIWIEVAKVEDSTHGVPFTDSDLHDCIEARNGASNHDPA